MEGRALDRDVRRDWAWVLPCVGMGLGEGVAALTGADRVPYLLTGLVAGAAWQVLHRRDLVARLTAPAAFVLVFVGTTLLLGGSLDLRDETIGPEALLLYVGGVLVALVLTEQYQRRQDGRALRPEAPGRTRGTARP